MQLSIQKEADHLIKAPHKLEEIVDEMEDYVARLRFLAIEVGVASHCEWVWLSVAKGR